MVTLHCVQGHTGLSYPF